MYKTKKEPILPRLWGFLHRSFDIFLCNQELRAPCIRVYSQPVAVRREAVQGYNLVSFYRPYGVWDVPKVQQVWNECHAPWSYNKGQAGQPRMALDACVELHESFPNISLLASGELKGSPKSLNRYRQLTNNWVKTSGDIKLTSVLADLRHNGLPMH